VFSRTNFKLKRFFEKYNLVNSRDYPAFFRFLTKKSFSLVSKSNFDFLSFSLISEVRIFLILLVFMNLKFNTKKNYTLNPTDHQNKMWIYFFKKRKYFILHIEYLIQSTYCGKPC